MPIRRAPDVQDLDRRFRLRDAVGALLADRDRPAQRSPGRPRLREVPVAAAERGEQRGLFQATGSRHLDQQREAGLVLIDGVLPLSGRLGRFGCCSVLLCLGLRRFFYLVHRCMISHGDRLAPHLRQAGRLTNRGFPTGPTSGYYSWAGTRWRPRIQAR